MTRLHVLTARTDRYRLRLRLPDGHDLLRLPIAKPCATTAWITRSSARSPAAPASSRAPMRDHPEREGPHGKRASRASTSLPTATPSTARSSTTSQGSRRKDLHRRLHQQLRTYRHHVRYRTLDFHDGLRAFRRRSSSPTAASERNLGLSPGLHGKKVKEDNSGKITAAQAQRLTAPSPFALLSSLKGRKHKIMAVSWWTFLSNRPPMIGVCLGKKGASESLYSLPASSR